MSVTQNVNLTTARHEMPPNIYMVQGDTGRVVTCTLLDYDIPSGATAKLFSKRPNGTYTSNDCTIDGNIVTVAIENGVLNHYGQIDNQLRIVHNEKVVKTFKFVITAQESVDGETTPEDISFLSQLEDELNEFMAEYADELAGKADSADVYTKSQVYQKSETYSKSEVDTAIANAIDDAIVSAIGGAY